MNFKKEQVFGDSNQKVLIERIVSVAVDKQDKVYIADGPQHKIHIFQPDGQYLNSIGQEGSGPGEFQTIGLNMKIKFNRLFIYDPYLQRINVFSLSSHDFSYAFTIPSDDEIQGSLLDQFFVRDDGSFLIGFESSKTPNIKRFIRYYVFDNRGKLLSNRIIEQQAATIFGGEVDKFSITSILPFSRKSLFEISNSDDIYSSWTEDFLIKVYDSKGRYQRSFFYPFKNSSLNRVQFLNQIPESNFKRAYRKVEFPDSWPALGSMFFDDQNRLWVSTIADDNEVYEWWMLKNTGEVITKFKWPQDEPIEEVKNGYLYARETDEETGLQQIVRYRIEMEEV